MEPHLHQNGWVETFEPWAGQNIEEHATLYVGDPNHERSYVGRVVRDDLWVHVQTEKERLSFPITQVHAIKWAELP